MGSRYLWDPPRTLRVACRDIAAAHPELVAGDCAACANGKLCAAYDRIERRPAAAEVARSKTPSTLTALPGARAAMGRPPS